MTLTNETIPITFIGGTGGSMLSQFLIKAKTKRFNEIKLSENGNTHLNYQDFKDCNLGIGDDDMSKITHITTENLIGKVTPYFMSMHLKDIELSKKYFNKIIRISYDDDSISDLAYIFLMKNIIDIQQIADDQLKFKVNQRKIFLKSNLPYFKHSISDDSILYVSWEEIYNGDVGELINTLADFTSIPNLNFNQRLINTWRQVTKTSLAKIKNRMEHGL